LATIRWRTRVSGFHLLRPIVKLADGAWLVGDYATAQSTGWVESEIQLADVRWRNLNIESVIEGRGGDAWTAPPPWARSRSGSRRKGVSSPAASTAGWQPAGTPDRCDRGSAWRCRHRYA